MKDKDFQELIQIIDPEQTRYLDYYEFVDLSEEKESMVSDISLMIISPITAAAKCCIVF